MLKQNGRLEKHDEEIQVIFNALKKLLNPPQEPRPCIGFRRPGEKINEPTLNFCTRKVISLRFKLTIKIIQSGSLKRRITTVILFSFYAVKWVKMTKSSPDTA